MHHKLIYDAIQLYYYLAALILLLSILRTNGLTQLKIITKGDEDAYYIVTNDLDLAYFEETRDGGVEHGWKMEEWEGRDSRSTRDGVGNVGVTRLASFPNDKIGPEAPDSTYRTCAPSLSTILYSEYLSGSDRDTFRTLQEDIYKRRWL
ncbi:hypothetical protein BDQ17DRAFT_1430721 [Cyathus striatus]|nr:hypothetical protein BDQ17DRAFT_1430721 [Cyathus striatus]